MVISSASSRLRSFDFDLRSLATNHEVIQAKFGTKEDVTQTNERMYLGLCCRYHHVQYSVNGVVCDFVSTWADNMHKIIDLIREKCAII